MVEGPLLAAARSLVVELGSGAGAILGVFQDRVAQLMREVRGLCRPMVALMVTARAILWR